MRPWLKQRTQVGRLEVHDLPELAGGEDIQIKEREGATFGLREHGENQSELPWVIVEDRPGRAPPGHGRVSSSPKRQRPLAVSGGGGAVQARLGKEPAFRAPGIAYLPQGPGRALDSDLEHFGRDLGAAGHEESKPVQIRQQVPVGQ